MKVDENNCGIHHKEAEDTEPGPSDFRKRINEKRRRTDSGGERPKYHLNNYVSFQDMRNKILFFFATFSKDDNERISRHGQLKC